MFGYAKSVRGAVIDCTPALFNQAVDSVQTARVCAAVADVVIGCQDALTVKVLPLEIHVAVIKSILILEGDSVRLVGFVPCVIDPLDAIVQGFVWRFVVAN